MTSPSDSSPAFSEPAPDQRIRSPPASQHDDGDDVRKVKDGEPQPETSTAAAQEPSEPTGPAETLATCVPATSPEPSKDAAEAGKEEGEADEEGAGAGAAQPALPAAGGPPLPQEPAPGDDDGWECGWSEEARQFYFFNRITQEVTWENPRVPSAASTAGAAAATAAQPAPPPPPLPSVAGGYNPAIHGDYDTWYAQYGPKEDENAGQTRLGAAAAAGGLADPSLLPYASGAHFNRLTGRYQQPGQGPERHGDEAKSRRQLNAFFDVDAAANAHDGRSLKAERAGKRLTKGELKHFKEKRRARKEEKRRAWLRD